MDPPNNLKTSSCRRRLVSSRRGSQSKVAVQCRVITNHSQSSKFVSIVKFWPEETLPGMETSVSENVWPETDPKFFGRTKFNGPSLSSVVCTCVDVGGGVCEGERGRESVRERARKCLCV